MYIVIVTAPAEVTPIGIGGRFKLLKTIVVSSTVNSGSGLTTNSMSYVAGQVGFILIINVRYTVCVCIERIS